MQLNQSKTLRPTDGSGNDIAAQGAEYVEKLAAQVEELTTAYERLAQKVADMSTKTDTETLNAVDVNVADQLAAKNANFSGDVSVEGVISAKRIELDETDFATKDEVARAVGKEADLRSAADAELQGNIDAEKAERIAADTALGTRIDGEISARESADTELQRNINTETAARSEADITLGCEIAAERTEREIADLSLQENIDAEATARKNADDELAETLRDELQAKILSEPVTIDGHEYGTVEGAIEMLAAEVLALRAEIAYTIIYVPERQMLVFPADTVAVDEHGAMTISGFNAEYDEATENLIFSR